MKAIMQYAKDLREDGSYMGYSREYLNAPVKTTVKAYRCCECGEITTHRSIYSMCNRCSGHKTAH